MDGHPFVCFQLAASVCLHWGGFLFIRYFRLSDHASEDILLKLLTYT